MVGLELEKMESRLSQLKRDLRKMWKMLSTWHCHQVNKLRKLKRHVANEFMPPIKE